MRLYLMRHGVAEDAAPGQPDATRALTSEGAERLRLQARALRHAGWPLGALVTSPLVRARQTAALVAEALGLTPATDDRLALGATPDHYAAVAVDARAEHVLLVGHQPDIEHTVYALTGGAVRVRKGSIALVDVGAWRPGGGRLRALYDPADLAAIGAALS